MAHFPRPRRWPLRWLPDRCSCGLPRFDRCPDAVSDAISGAGAPRGGKPARGGPGPGGATALGSGPAGGPPNQPRHEGDDPQSRLGRW
jgi:hypothetical protein